MPLLTLLLALTAWAVAPHQVNPPVEGTDGNSYRTVTIGRQVWMARAPVPLRETGLWRQSVLLS